MQEPMPRDSDRRRTLSGPVAAIMDWSNFSHHALLTHIIGFRPNWG